MVVGGLDRALNRRARPQAEAAGVAAQMTRVTHTFHAVGVSTPGIFSHEGIYQVDFPVKFVEKPAFSFGAEFTGVTLAGRAIPVCSVIIAEWVVDEEMPDLYVGAILGVVTGGERSNPMDIQVHFEAVSFRGSV